MSLTRPGGKKTVFRAARTITMREILYNTMAALVPGLGFDALPWLGNALATVLWRAMPKRRRLAQKNIAERLGVPASQAAVMARSAFRHNSRSFLEMLFINQIDWRFIQDRLIIADPDLFEALSKDTRPAVVTTAHMGAWELQAGLIALTQTRPSERMVVVRRSRDQALNELMARLRTRPGLRVVPHRQAVFPVLKSLRHGGLTGFLVDHNCPENEAIFLPFLGKTAAVNVGPALLAVRGQARVWPLFLLRQAQSGHYIVHQEPPLDTTELTGERDGKIRKTAEYYTACVEKYVNMYPEQWYWMHNRWKTRPPGEEEEEDRPRRPDKRPRKKL